MPRVLQVQSRICIGGPAKFTLPLSESMTWARGSRYDTLLVGGRLEPGEVSMIPEALERGVRVQVLDSMRRPIHPRRDLQAILQVGGIIRREKPVVVHTHTAKAGAVGRMAAWIHRVPAIIHTFHGHVFEGYFDPKLTDRFVRIERMLARVSDRILVLSEAQKADIVERYRIAPASKVRVVPLGLQLGGFRTLDRSTRHQRSDRFRRQFGIGDEAQLVVAVGRLAPIKRFDRLIRAFLRAVESRPDSHLIVVGDGDESEKARLRSLSSHPHVHFAGYRTDMDRILSDADVLALSSDNEGTPVAVIEALVAGVPVVATDVGGVREIVPEGCGIIVSREDESGFVAGLVHVLAGGCYVASACRDRTLHRFSQKRTIQAIEALYDEVLERKRTGSSR